MKMPATPFIMMAPRSARAASARAAVVRGRRSSAKQKKARVQRVVKRLSGASQSPDMAMCVPKKSGELMRNKAAAKATKRRPRTQRQNRETTATVASPASSEGRRRDSTGGRCARSNRAMVQISRGGLGLQ
jgi:hypothetical protein